MTRGYSGATNTTLVLSGLTLTNTGNFRLVASNALGVATSVVPLPLVVLDQTNLLMLGQLRPYGRIISGTKSSSPRRSRATAGAMPMEIQWRGHCGRDRSGSGFDPILLANAGIMVAISNQSSGLVSLTSTQRVTMVRVWGYLSDPICVRCAADIDKCCGPLRRVMHRLW